MTTAERIVAEWRTECPDTQGVSPVSMALLIKKVEKHVFPFPVAAKKGCGKDFDRGEIGILTCGEEYEFSLFLCDECRSRAPAIVDGER